MSLVPDFRHPKPWIFYPDGELHVVFVLLPNQRLLYLKNSFRLCSKLDSLILLCIGQLSYDPHFTFLKSHCYKALDLLLQPLCQVLKRRTKVPSGFVFSLVLFKLDYDRAAYLQSSSSLILHSLQSPECGIMNHIKCFIFFP